MKWGVPTCAGQHKVRIQSACAVQPQQSYHQAGIV